MKRIISLVMTVSLAFSFGFTRQANATEIENMTAVVNSINLGGESLINQNQQSQFPSISNIYGVKINVDSAIEQCMANNLISGETRFSLKGYPEAQNVQAVVDIFCKVVYQNPLIMSVENFKYDYSNLILTVEYKDSKDVIAKKQQEILTEAKRIINTTITAGMTDEQKRKAFYDYLNKNTKYDKQALTTAQQNNFKGSNEGFEDSFNTYGIMVKKVGVCVSYANSYKLLCDLSGIDCIVVLGTYNNIAHAWNKVKINNEWLTIDCTNSETNTGIPYMMYEGNDNALKGLGYIENNGNYWIDSELTKFIGVTNAYEYYESNDLVVNDIAQYKAKFAELFKSGQTKMSFKLGNIADPYTVKYATNQVINDIAKDKLELVNYNSNGKFIVITIS